jgi:hypothetical protein
MRSKGDGKLSRLQEVKNELQLNKSQINSPKFLTVTDKFFDDITWLIERAEKAEELEKRFEEYTGTLNETRRKRDDVKNRLAIVLKENKELIKENEMLHSAVEDDPC